MGGMLRELALYKSEYIPMSLQQVTVICKELHVFTVFLVFLPCSLGVHVVIVRILDVQSKVIWRFCS